MKHSTSNTPIKREVRIKLDQDLNKNFPKGSYKIVQHQDNQVEVFKGKTKVKLIKAFLLDVYRSQVKLTKTKMELANSKYNTRAIGHKVLVNAESGL